MTEEAEDPANLPDPRPANEMQGGPGHDVAELRARQVQALRLRRLGMTYDQIAEQMGFANRSGARNLIMRVLEEQVSDSVVALRELENERLDTGTAALMGIIGSRDTPSATRVRAVEAYTRLSARRSRLNGLDAPLRVEVTPGALSALDDALKLLEDVVMHDTIPGEVLRNDDEDPPPAGALVPTQPAPSTGSGGAAAEEPQ